MGARENYRAALAEEERRRADLAAACQAFLVGNASGRSRARGLGAGVYDAASYFLRAVDSSIVAELATATPAPWAPVIENGWTA